MSLNRWIILVITFQRVRYVRKFQLVSRNNAALIWEIVLHGAVFSVSITAYIIFMNHLARNTKGGVVVEFLPFYAVYLILMIPMASIIVYKTREIYIRSDNHSRRFVKEFQGLTFIVALFCSGSVIFDIAEEIYTLTTGSKRSIKTSLIMEYLSMWFHMLNCAINFFIYLVFSKTFRMTLANRIKKFCQRQCESVNVNL